MSKKIYQPFTFLTDDYGTLPIYSINAFRGKCSVDPEKFAEYLLTYENNRSTDDSSDIKYQDFVLPVNHPDNPLLIKVLEQIVGKLSKNINKAVRVLGGWTIIHHKEHQTYPHGHLGGDGFLACVYWAKVPEGSGFLEFYPEGLPGPEIKVKPVAGDFMVFPGDLLHGVRQNTSDEPRISMSLNLQVEL